MGHFSYSCALSGVPITEGEHAAILPIIPHSLTWGYDCSQMSLSHEGQSTFVSNEGVNVFFDELCFPIFGEYNSYGRIENIERDENVTVLEEYFSLPIQDICDILCDSDKVIPDNNNPRQQLLIRASLVWMHTDVYRLIALNADKSRLRGSLDLGNHELLLRLGFTYKGLSKDKRYNKIYEKDGLRVFSDGCWIGQEESNLYNLYDFKKYCASHDVNINISKIPKDIFSQIYDIVLEYKTDISDAFSDRFIRELLLYNQNILIRNTKDSDEITKGDMIAYHYYRNIKKHGYDFLRSNIIDFFAVKDMFFNTGRYFYPIGISPQDGEPDQVKILLESSLKVIKSQINKRK